MNLYLFPQIARDQEQLMVEEEEDRIILMDVSVRLNYHSEVSFRFSVIKNYDRHINDHLTSAYFLRRKVMRNVVYCCKTLNLGTTGGDYGSKGRSGGLDEVSSPISNV